MNYEGNINDDKRCHYQKKSVYKREYYLKKKIELFQEKYGFIFSENDLKMIEVFYQLNDKKIIRKIKEKFNKKTK